MDTILIISLMIAVASALMMLWDIYKEAAYKRFVMITLASASLLLCVIYTINTLKIGGF